MLSQEPPIGSDFYRYSGKDGYLTHLYAADCFVLFLLCVAL